MVVVIPIISVSADRESVMMSLFCKHCGTLVRRKSQSITDLILVLVLWLWLWLWWSSVVVSTRCGM